MKRFFVFLIGLSFALIIGFVLSLNFYLNMTSMLFISGFGYAFFYLIVTSVKSGIKEMNAWNALPTLDEYLRLYPNSKTNSGISCNHCQTRSIKNWGISGPNSLKRVHICNHCNSKLYRTSS